MNLLISESLMVVTCVMFHGSQMMSKGEVGSGIFFCWMYEVVCCKDKCWDLSAYSLRKGCASDRNNGMEEKKGKNWDIQQERSWSWRHGEIEMRIGEKHQGSVEVDTLEGHKTTNILVVPFN